MLDAARAAEMADPDLNPQFCRRWNAPPLKRKAPPAGGTAKRGGFRDGNKDDIALPAEIFNEKAEARA